MNTNLNEHNGTNNQYPDFVQMQAYVDKSTKERSEALFNGIRQVKHSIENLVSRYSAYRMERKAIKELSQLSPEMLRDIGITKNDIHRVQRGDETLTVLAEQRSALMASTATASHARKQGLWLVDLKIRSRQHFQHSDPRKVA